MALIKCPECGKEFSDKAEACPNCGCPTQEISSAKVSTFEDVFDAPKAVTVMNKGSIKIAKKMILPQENVLFASVFNVSIEPVVGKLKPKITIKGKKSYVIAITDKRVICVRSERGIGNLGVSEQKQIFISDITSIDSKGVLSSVLRITGLTEMFVIDCNSKMMQKMLNALSTARN